MNDGHVQTDAPPMPSPQLRKTLCTFRPMTGLLITAIAWICFGFLFGSYWLAFLFVLASNGAERIVAGFHLFYSVAALSALAGGGIWCRMGTGLPCPGGEEMSRTCLFTSQTNLYQAVYVLHFVGLGWLATAWIFDGVQLLSYLRALKADQPLTVLFSKYRLGSPLYSAGKW